MFRHDVGQRTGPLFSEGLLCLETYVWARVAKKTEQTAEKIMDQTVEKPAKTSRDSRSVKGRFGKRASPCQFTLDTNYQEMSRPSGILNALYETKSTPITLHRQVFLILTIAFKGGVGRRGCRDAEPCLSAFIDYVVEQ